MTILVTVAEQHVDLHEVLWGKLAHCFIRKIRIISIIKHLDAYKTTVGKEDHKIF